MNHNDLIKHGLPAFRVIDEEGSPVYCTATEAEIWRERGIKPEPLCLVPESFLHERTDMIRERAELARLRKQKPALYMAFSECGQFIRYWTRDTANLDATMAVNDFAVLEFYAAPVPAVAAPAELDAPMDIHDLAYELGGTDSGEYHLEPEDLDRIVAAVKAAPAVPAPTPFIPDDDTRRNDEAFSAYCANRAVLNGAPGELVEAAPSVPEEWREFVSEVVSPLRYAGEHDMAQKARALLQSEGCSSQTQNEVRHD